MIVRAAMWFLVIFGALSSCRISLDTIHRHTTSICPWAVCTKAFPYGRQLCSLSGIITSRRSTPLLEPCLFLSAECFLQWSELAPSGSLNKAAYGETSKSKIRPWSCSQGLLGWSHAITASWLRKQSHPTATQTQNLDMSWSWIFDRENDISTSLGTLPSKAGKMGMLQIYDTPEPIFILHSYLN